MRKHVCRCGRGDGGGGGDGCRGGVGVVGIVWDCNWPPAACTQPVVDPQLPPCVQELAAELSSTQRAAQAAAAAQEAAQAEQARASRTAEEQRRAAQRVGDECAMLRGALDQAMAQVREGPGCVARWGLWIRRWCRCRGEGPWWCSLTPLLALLGTRAAGCDGPSHGPGACEGLHLPCLFKCMEAWKEGAQLVEPCGGLCPLHWCWHVGDILQLLLLLTGCIAELALFCTPPPPHPCCCRCSPRAARRARWWRSASSPSCSSPSSSVAVQRTCLCSWRACCR